MSTKAILKIRSDTTPHWVGDGFPVRSLFSYGQDPAAISPFLLLDYAGPAEFPPTPQQRGVGEHPHKGFETVTIVYQGELEHRDSAGHSGAIGPGDVQWMTAASGLVHEEFHSRSFAERGGVLEMVQLWVNLPAADKKKPPRYQELLAAQIPTVALAEGAGTARIITGEFQGTRGPAQTFTRVGLWDLALSAGKSTVLNFPEGDNTLLLVRKGAIVLNGASEASGVALVRCSPEGDRLEITAETDAQVLVLTGQPIAEPVVGQGPFVMNTAEEIRQAIIDYQAGLMGHLS